MVKMQKHILLLIILLSAVLLNAQEMTWEEFHKILHGGLSNEDFFNQSELVIEGKMLKVVDTYDTKGDGKRDDMYSILRIKVQSVYKGDQSLIGDTVYTVCKKTMLTTMFFSYYPREKEYDERGALIIYDVRHTSPSVFRQNYIHGGITFDNPCIFFLTTSDLPDSKEPKYSHYPKYKFLNQHEESRLWTWGTEKTLGLNNLVFDTREELYNYMRQFEGYTVPEPAPSGQTH